MKKVTIIISTSLMVALIAGSVFAWGPGKGQGRGMKNNNGSQYCQGYGNQNALNDLSKEQQKELTALRQDFIDNTYELRSAKMEKRQQVRLLMQTSNPDRAKLTSMHDEMDNLKKQIREKRLDFQIAAKKIAPGVNFDQGFGKGRGGRGSGGGQRQWRGSGNCNN